MQFSGVNKEMLGVYDNEASEAADDGTVKAGSRAGLDITTMTIVMRLRDIFILSMTMMKTIAKK